MSLPPASKDISIHPAKGSVVDPIDKVKREKDIQQKLKLYTAIQALRGSRLPSNAQVNQVFSYFQNGSESIKKEHKLSRETQQLFSDFNNVLEAFKGEVNSKNHDELIQELIWDTREGETSVKVKVNGDVKEPPVGKEKAKADADKALQNFRTIGSLILTNSEARKLVSDFSLVGRDLLARGAAKASQTIAPSEEQLRAVNDSVKSDQKFVDRDQLKREKEQAQHVGDQVKVEAKEAALQGAERAAQTDTGRQALDAAPGVSRSDATQGDSLTVSGLGNTGQIQTPYQVSTLPTGDTDLRAKRPGFEEGETTSDEEPGEVKKSKFMDRFRSKGTEQFGKGKTFLTEEYFPKDRRDQWIWRAKKVIIECQENSEYQEAITGLLDYFEEYVEHGRKYAGDVKGKVDVDGSEDVWGPIRVLLDRFADGRSIQHLIIDKLNVLLQDANNDEEMRVWIKDVGQWIRELLTTPGYIMEPASASKGDQLLEQGRKFHGYRVVTSTSDNTEAANVSDLASAPTNSPMSPIGSTNGNGKSKSVGIESIEGEGKYKPHFNALFDGMSEWFGGWKEDAGNRRVTESISRLTKTLLFSPTTNKMEFKREMWTDLRTTLLPLLIEKVGYVPIPRIEYTDEALDLVVENLTLSGQNLFPTQVAVEAHNYAKWSPYGGVRAAQDSSRHEFIVTLSQMQADMRDVAFYFKKKTGLPKIKDSGLADVLVGGEGVSVTIHISSTSKDKTDSFIEIKNVHVKVANLKFAIRDSKHDLLYKTLKPLASGLIKKQIAKAIKDGIETGLKLLDGQLVAVRDRMAEANEDVEGHDKKGKMDVIGDMFKRTKSRSEDETSHSAHSRPGSTMSGSSQFKVVSSAKRRSVNAGHPTGWVNRVQEKEAFTGAKGWKCDAFDVTPATTTTTKAA